jgi:hypothetical protein
MLEIASLLRRVGDGQFAAGIAKLAGMLLNFHRLHVGSSMLVAMDGMWGRRGDVPSR